MSSLEKIRQEQTNDALRSRINALEAEVARLRQLIQENSNLIDSIKEECFSE